MILGIGFISSTEHFFFEKGNRAFLGPDLSFRVQRPLKQIHALVFRNSEIQRNGGSWCQFSHWSFCSLDVCAAAEGVLYAKKDYNLAKHPQIDVPNLQVIKLMQSFKSKEYVRETFSWQYYYWYLTNDGIEHLRNYLNLPSEIVPATLKKSARPPGRPFGSGPPGDRPR